MLPGLALLLFLGACGGGSKEDKAAELETEVIEIHDLAMAKMGEVAYLVDTLSTILSHIEMSDSLPDSAFIAQLKTCIQDMETADEGMMNWMRNYNPPSEEMAVEDKLAYLKEEKKKVTEVQKQFETSIPAGRECLEQAENR